MPFGKRKCYTGVVHKIVEKTNTQYAVKEILDILDEAPIINQHQLSFLNWLSSYYMCALGDAYNAALPSGLKLSSESYVGLFPDLEINYVSLSEKESIIIQFLENQELSTDEVVKITGLKQPYKLIKGLVDKKLVYLYEKVKDKYQPKTETRIRLSATNTDADKLNELAATLDKKPKQLDVLLGYLKEVPILESPLSNEKGFNRKTFIQSGLSSSSLNTLIKKGVFEKWEQNVDRFSFDDSPLLELPSLSDGQHLAKQEINISFEQF